MHAMQGRCRLPGNALPKGYGLRVVPDTRERHHISPRRRFAGPDPLLGYDKIHDPGVARRQKVARREVGNRRFLGIQGFHTGRVKASAQVEVVRVFFDERLKNAVPVDNLNVVPIDIGAVIDSGDRDLGVLRGRGGLGEFHRFVAAGNGGTRMDHPNRLKSHLIKH